MPFDHEQPREMTATPELRTVKLSSVLFDESIYPRRAHDPSLVQRYAEVIDEIEAAQQFICVSADLKLLDGKHRWLAYRKLANGDDRDISVRVYPVTAPHDQLELSAKLNSDHGWQLTEEDKEQTAKSLYAYGMTYERIATALSVGKATVSKWLARTVKENKDKRDRAIFDLWLACHTQEEIAERVGCPVGTVKDLLAGESSLVGKVLENQSNQAAASHATDFEPPIYNVWKQQTKTAGVGHFGNSEARWVDNLLYLYTEPFDVVVDPFAGSGSTIDICKKRYRRYWVGDRAPIVERETEIRKHDVVDGIPPLPRWKDVKLVYLDPPYWIQARGKYSDSPNDLANMELETFHTSLAKLIRDFLSRAPSAAVALIIQPTQWRNENREFEDHVAALLRRVNARVVQRIQAPYESQQYNGNQVEIAKRDRLLLALSREIVVWKK